MQEELNYSSREKLLQNARHSDGGPFGNPVGSKLPIGRHRAAPWQRCGSQNGILNSADFDYIFPNRWRPLFCLFVCVCCQDAAKRQLSDSYPHIWHQFPCFWR